MLFRSVDIKNIGKLSHIGEVGGALVPEPATMLLFGTGVAGLAGIARRKRSQLIFRISESQDRV